MLETIGAHSKLFFEERKAVFVSRLEDEKEVKAKLKSIDLKELDNKKNLKTNAARLVRLTTLMQYYCMSGDAKKHYEISKENLAFQLEQFNKNKTLVQQINLVIAYMNHCNTCIDTGQLSEAEKELTRLKALDCPHKGVLLHKTFCEVHVQQEIHFWNSEFAKGAEFSKQAMAQPQIVKNAKEQIFVFLAMLGNQTLFHLFSNNAKAAYLSVQELRLLAKEAENPKLSADIWLTEILIQQQMGNSNIAESIYALLKKWNDKSKLLSKPMMEAVDAALKKKELQKVKDDYFIFNRFRFNDCMAGLYGKQPLAELITASTKQLVAQKKAFK